jgi:ankyrin repeat protein
MPIENSVFQEFLTAEVVDALKMAEILRPDINLPLVGSDLPPILDFCMELKYSAEKILEKNEKLWIVNEKTTYGYTILHLACLNNHYDIVKMLLSNEKINSIIDINSVNLQLQTPLHIAIERRKLSWFGMI